MLISDYAMPHLSGTEFLRGARELCPNVPALIITGYAEADAISDRPEGVEILLKPFTPNALDAAIARAYRLKIAALRRFGANELGASFDEPCNRLNSQRV